MWTQDVHYDTKILRVHPIKITVDSWRPHTNQKSCRPYANKVENNTQYKINIPLFNLGHTQVQTGFKWTFSKVIRPCFDGGDRLTNRRVFLDVNGSVDSLIPNWWFVGSVDNVDFNLNCSRKRGSAPILGYSFQSVWGSLCVFVCSELKEEEKKDCMWIFSLI